MKFLLFWIIALFFISCNNRVPQKELDLDLIYDKVALYDEINSTYPYNYTKFHNVLDQSGYQYPYAKTIVNFGKFDGFKSKSFFADADGILYFALNKEKDKVKKRSELRQVYTNPLTKERDSKSGWKTSDPYGHFWIAEIRCYKPEITQAYTWMQVHGLDGVDLELNDGRIVKSFNYPIIRLTWERDRTGIYDHIWAIIIISNPRDPKIYKWIDLGPRPDNFFKAEVHFQNNIMKVLIDEIVMFTYDVTYWEEEPNYFKAGIYINRFTDEGVAIVAYKDLRFENNISKIQ